MTKNILTLKSLKSKCLTGKLSVPADKSISIRALLISSICFGNTKISNLLEFHVIIVFKILCKLTPLYFAAIIAIKTFFSCIFPIKLRFTSRIELFILILKN